MKICKLGEGAYGTVYKVKEKGTGNLFALKKINVRFNDEGIPVHALREASLLKRLCHKNIVKVYETRYDMKKRKVYIRLEYIDCDLGKFIKNEIMPLGLIKSLAHQLLSGVAYLHDNLIMHRDLKPSNVLIDKETGILRICDFGLAKPLSLPTGGLTISIQTLWYRAPEILLGLDSYSFSVDIWSIGCILAEFGLGKPLFDSNSEVEAIMRIFFLLGSPSKDNILTLAPNYSIKFPHFKEYNLDYFLEDHDIDSDLIDLICMMLKIDPDERISASKALNHPFFNR